VSAGGAGEEGGMNSVSLVTFLNEIASTDGAALGLLISHRVPCSAVLADHPTVQVRDTPDGPQVGMLGILCGWHEAATGQRLVAVEEDGTVLRFVGADPDPVADKLPATGAPPSAARTGYIVAPGDRNNG